MLSSLATPAPAPAQQPPPASGAPGAPALPHASAPYTAKPPVIDGEWTPGEWDAAPPVSFPAPAPQGPLSGAPAPAPTPTEVRFLYDDAGLYVTFRCIDATPVFGAFKPGEPLHQEDVCELFLDEKGDHRQFTEIQFDPAGRLYLRNHVLTAEPRITPEGRLTPEFCDRELWRYSPPTPEAMRVASRLDRTTGVWIAELFLPAAFVQRRGGGGPMKPGTWRINLVRHDWSQPLATPGRALASCAMMYWAPVQPGHPHISPTRMGYMVLEAKPSAP